MGYTSIVHKRMVRCYYRWCPAQGREECRDSAAAAPARVVPPKKEQRKGVSQNKESKAE